MSLIVSCTIKRLYTVHCKKIFTSLVSCCNTNLHGLDGRMTILDVQNRFRNGLMGQNKLVENGETSPSILNHLKYFSSYRTAYLLLLLFMLIGIKKGREEVERTLL